MSYLLIHRRFCREVLLRDLLLVWVTCSYSISWRSITQLLRDLKVSTWRAIIPSLCDQHLFPDLLLLLPLLHALFLLRDVLLLIHRVMLYYLLVPWHSMIRSLRDVLLPIGRLDCWEFRWSGPGTLKKRSKTRDLTERLWHQRTRSSWIFWTRWLRLPHKS